MRKYIIKILPADGCNPEYAPSKEMQRGYEAEGFAMLIKKDDGTDRSIVYGMNMLDMGRAMMEDASLFRAGAAVAEGYRKAMDINCEGSDARGSLAEALKRATKAMNMDLEDGTMED